MKPLTEIEKKMLARMNLSEADVKPKPEVSEVSEAGEVDRLRQEVTELRGALEALLEGVTE